MPETEGGGVRLTSSSGGRDPYMPSLDAYPNYLGRRSLPAQAPARRPATTNPWLAAAAAYALGTATLLVLGFLLGLAGVVLAVSQRGGDGSYTRFVLLGVLGLVAIEAGSVIVQARFLRSRGCRRAVAAPLVAAVAGWVLGAALDPLGVPFLPTVLLQAALAIPVMALMMGRPDTRR